MSQIRIFILLFCIFLTNCGKTTKQKEITSTVEGMTFTVNRQLLKDSLNIIDEKMIISIPKSWKPLPDSLKSSLTSKVETFNARNDSSAIQLNIHSVYVQPDNKASLVISRLSFPKNDSTESLQRKHYTQQMKTGIDSTSLGIAEFSKDGIFITQYMIRTLQSVSFKLLFKAHKSMMQCDYIIPTNAFQQEIRAVESSIGSIFISQ